MSNYSTPEPLQKSHDTTKFSCGDDALNDWLRRHALQNQSGGGSRTYVTLDGSRVAGYYALAATSVSHATATFRAGHGMPGPIPAILLGRLAVDERDQGHHLGGDLLQDAIMRAVATAEVIGVRVMLVHAASSAAAKFYRHHGFEESPVLPLHLMMLMKDARAALRKATS